MTPFSIKDTLELIIEECNILYERDIPGERINKFYLSGRKIVELSLKIIFYRNNPTRYRDDVYLNTLVTYMEVFPEFNQSFISFLKYAQKKGNNDAHKKNYKFKFDSYREDLYYYLEWFFISFERQNLPTEVTEWYVNNIEKSKPYQENKKNTSEGHTKNTLFSTQTTTTKIKEEQAAAKARAEKENMTEAGDKTVDPVINDYDKYAYETNNESRTQKQLRWLKVIIERKKKEEENRKQDKG